MGKLNIVSGNILDYLDNKDLIVNSVNKYMICGSGVCGAIYKSANKELLEEYCKDHYKENMKVNEIRFSPGFDLGTDILHIYCPKSYESKEQLKELLESYNKIFVGAKNKGYKNIISVSLGTGVHGYKHNDIAKDVIIRLKELVKEYNIDFTLVLPSEEIKEIYSFK
ncbi:MAG: macro domain-containing protein [Bacilli bacterium]